MKERDTAKLVRIENRPVGSASDLLNSIRTWLDHRNVELISFKAAPVERGRIAFDMSFRTEEEAFLFQLEFGGRYFFTVPF